MLHTNSTVCCLVTARKSMVWSPDGDALCWDWHAVHLYPRFPQSVKYILRVRHTFDLRLYMFYSTHIVWSCISPVKFFMKSWLCHWVTELCACVEVTWCAKRGWCLCSNEAFWLAFHCSTLLVWFQLWYKHINIFDKESNSLFIEIFLFFCRSALSLHVLWWESGRDL